MSLASAVDAVVSLVQETVATGAVKAAALHEAGEEKTPPRLRDGGPRIHVPLGSITKPFTALAVMILADRGALKLSDPAMR